MPWQVIPNWVRKQGRPVSVAEIAKRMNLTLGVALRKVIELTESGELVDLGGDRITAPPYKWDVPPKEAPATQQRIWRAVCIVSMKGGGWTAKDISRLAEANHDYTRDYLKWLVGQGHLLAQRRPPGPYRFRLLSDAPPISQTPIWWNRRNRKYRRRKKQSPLVREVPAMK